MSQDTSQDKVAKDYQTLQQTPDDALPVLPATTRNEEVLQWFYRMVLDSFACINGRTSPLHLRRDQYGLYIRVDNQWRQYKPREDTDFWRDAMTAYPDLAESNWSIKRMRDLWGYFQTYTPTAEFDNRRYFEMPNAILDGQTGKLNYSPNRFLEHPTTRSSLLAYNPDYKPTAAWQHWYDTLDVHHKQVRNWSVGSALIGEYGLLFTFGNSRTGKSTLAEGLANVLGSGAKKFTLSKDFGRFNSRSFENTTYLYDPDSKGSKNHNNANYEMLHLMASGDPIDIEIKGGDLYQTTNYGFVEVISNAPVGLSFEQSLVDRVRFCLYTYIDFRGDGGDIKRLILADKQAWLNYAVECAIGLATHTVKRPDIDKYQAYGWVLWLKGSSSYGRMCVEESRIVTYSEYQQVEASRYQSSKETVEDIQAGIKELSRQLGEDILRIDWQEYGNELKQMYYNEDNNGNKKTAKLF